jgi:FHS family glucose/mannose:H+ symporter-like MFS transporter
MSDKAKTTLLLSGLSSLFVVGAGSAIIGPALPVYEQAFHISTATSGLLVSTLWVGCLGGVLAMYFRGAQIAPRLPLALLVLGSALLALAPLWSLTLTGALIFGAGYGAIAALFNPRVLRAYDDKGASRVGMLNALYSFGAILAPYGFTLIGGDLRPVFWTISAVSAVTWIFSGRVGLTGLAVEAHGRGFRLHLPILGLALLAIGIEASLSGLGPTALIRSGVSEHAAALLLSLFFVAALATRIALVLTAHRFADFGIFVFAVIWAMLCALGAALFNPAFFFPPMGVAAGLFFQGEYVTATRKMGDDPRVSPVILAVGLIGAIGSPLVYAQFMDALGPHGFFWLIAGVAGVASLIALGSYRAMMR